MPALDRHLVKRVNSLTEVTDRLVAVDVELIVIARGGGSKTDLSFLDNEAIVRKLVGSPLPVWTGIGHEVDVSVLDFVANRSFKTPTAVAEELVGRFVQMRRQLDESANTLRTVWSYQLKLKRNQEYRDRSKTGIRQGVRKLLEVTASQLREQAQMLRLRVQGRISDERSQRNVWEKRLRTAPLGTLKITSDRLSTKQ